jgi:hypothetical protein
MADAEDAHGVVFKIEQDTESVSASEIAKRLLESAR